MKKVTYRLKGVAPLLLHNAMLADPGNVWAKNLKQISSKRKKTEEDFAKMSEIEWFGSLYISKSNKSVIIPGNMVEATLINGAKKNKLGQIFKAGVFTERDFELEHDGAKNVEELWKDENFRFITPVVVQRNKVMRTRPKFENWSVNVEVAYYPDVVNESQILDALKIAGSLVGFGDWRPKFGRFEVVA